MTPSPRLVVLTDRAQLPLGSGLVPALEQCVAVGLTQVWLRELDLARPRREALCARLTAIGLEVVAAREPLSGCVGVHLAAHQSASDSAGQPFGRSCHSAEDVRRAAGEGASWATLGPFAPSVSKPGRDPIAGEAYAGLPIPTYALAGVTPANAAAAIAAGADGVAVMGAVMRASDPADVVERVLQEVRR